MMKKLLEAALSVFVMLIFLVAARTASATQTTDTTILPSGSGLVCGSCHNGNMVNSAGIKLTEWTSWASSAHAKTQADPAGELAEEDIGNTPAFQIANEDCISCHSPTAVLANNGMTETSALSYFFTTNSSGEFYSGTTAQHKSEWPDVACTACHDASKGHPSSLNLALFNSRKFSDAFSSGASVADATSTAETSVLISGTSSYNTSLLCGQCHGSLQAQNEGDNAIPYYEFAKKLSTGEISSNSEWSGTDHLTYDAWKLSKHGNTQAGPALTGHASAGCLDCHAPTAVQQNGGMTSTVAFNYFYGKDNSSGKQTILHTKEWPNIACIVCHDPHQPAGSTNLSFFDNTKGTYGERVPVASSQDLCGQCHGNLRETDSRHLSYNILQGKEVKDINGVAGFDGGVGVQDQKTMPGAACVDCHMNGSSDADNNQRMTHGHTWQVIVNGGDPNYTAGWGWDLGAFAGDTSNPDGDAPHLASCTKCHRDMTAYAAEGVIEQWKIYFAALQATAKANYATAKAAMKGVQNAALQAKLDEANGNLTYAGGDESGGFHNHNYVMALLDDANEKSLEVINANPQSTPSATSTSGGGGGCAINPNAGFNPTLPLLIVLSLFYFYYRSKKQNS